MQQYLYWRVLTLYRFSEKAVRIVNSIQIVPWIKGLYISIFGQMVCDISSAFLLNLRFFCRILIYRMNRNILSRFQSGEIYLKCRIASCLSTSDRRNGGWSSARDYLRICERDVEKICSESNFDKMLTDANWITIS